MPHTGAGYKKRRDKFSPHTGAGYKKRLENDAPPSNGGVIIYGEKMDENDIKPGYVYHIKDLYFETVKDDKLMRNHEGGAYRPTYFCLKDNKTGLFWVIPMSSRVDKYINLVKVSRKIVI